MNPFLLQVELSSQWFGMASAMANAVSSSYLTLGQQTMQVWSAVMPRLPGAAQPTNSWMPRLPAGNPSLTSLPASSMLSPWTAAAQWPGGWNPFGIWAGAATMGLGGWPRQPYTGPVLPMLPWLGLWGMGSRLGAPFGNPTARQPSSADFFEQVAANYRTVNGYAVAVVLGPYGVPIEKTFGQVWWQTPSRPRGH